MVQLLLLNTADNDRSQPGQATVELIEYVDHGWDLLQGQSYNDDKEQDRTQQVHCITSRHLSDR